MKTMIGAVHHGEFEADSRWTGWFSARRRRRVATVDEVEIRFLVIEV